MTRAEILALPAGPELDALIAEKVMGWSPMDSGRDFWHDGRGGQRKTAYGSHPFCVPFHPSADIAAAWLVVEKVRGAGLHVEIESVEEPDGSHDAWRAGIHNGAHPFQAGAAYAPTAPMALCRAVLFALESCHAG